MHPKWDSGVARILLKAADEDGDDSLDYEEFLSWLLAGNNEWNPIKQAMMLSTDDEDPEPRVDRSKTEEASPHGEKFAALAAHARERLLKPTSEERASLSLKEAAAMKDLVELARQHKELTDLLQQFPFDLEAEAMSTVDFSSWSISRLKEYLTSHGGSLEGAVEKVDLVERCQQLHREQNQRAEVDEEDLAYAERIDARLRCLRLLQDQQEPDPVQLAIALRQAQRLLVEEPCVTAILTHSQRLGMRAEDKLKTAKTVPEMEQALDLMEAVKDVKLPDGRINCVSSTALDEANSRLQGVRSKEDKIGVRSLCGPFVKTSSIKGDSTLQQAKLQLAQVWCRPVESLDFFAADGAPLDSEEKWQDLIRGVQSLELKLVLDRGRLGRKGSKAGLKPKDPKAKLAAKKSLASLAASTSPWRT